MNSTNPYFDPSRAKLAAQIIKSQQNELESAKEKIAALEDEVSKLQRFDECIKIAHQLSEIGRISKDFGSIIEKAESIANSDKDLSVIKEAIDMAQNNFDLGSIDNSKPGLGGGTDAITEALISLIS